MIGNDNDNDNNNYDNNDRVMAIMILVKGDKKGRSNRSGKPPFYSLLRKNKTQRGRESKVSLNPKCLVLAASFNADISQIYIEINYFCIKIMV